MNAHALAQSQGVFQEQIHGYWRDWMTYLNASLTLLDAQSVARLAAFERDEARETDVAHAQQQLAILPAAQRALYERIREERRQQAQLQDTPTPQNGRQRSTDPDQIDRMVLEALRADADGSAEQLQLLPGWGIVPVEIEGVLTWYEVNAAMLRDAPSTAAYAAGRSDGDDLRRRIVLATGLGVAAVVFLLAWFLWPRNGKPLLLSNQWAATSNGEPLSFWPVRRVEVGAATERVVITLQATGSERWSGVTPSQGAWRTQATAPIRICLPAKLIAGTSQVTLYGDPATPARTYRLSNGSSGEADLVIDPCEGDTALRRVGTLEQTNMPPQQSLREAVAIADGQTIRVEAITLVGAGSDPLLTPDTDRVEIQISAPPLDWPLFLPTLTLDSGERIQTAEQVAQPDGIVLRYLIPHLPGERMLAWQLTPAGGEPLIWRATMAEPVDRTTFLHNTIAMNSVTAVTTISGTTIQVTIANHSELPVPLTPADIVLSQGPNVVLVQSMLGIETVLAPGERRIVTIAISTTDFSPPVVLSLGTTRFQLAQ